MGTNYYAHQDVCVHCGRGEAPKHIGKSSMGWCFSLHVYPDEGILDLPDWEKVINKPGVLIKDEYGNSVSAAEMMEIITNRDGKPWPRPVPAMYGSWDEFHARNHSTEGPKGLLRHAVDNKYCVGHGEGTWDRLVGEFS